MLSFRKPVSSDSSTIMFHLAVTISNIQKLYVARELPKTSCLFHSSRVSNNFLFAWQKERHTPRNLSLLHVIDTSQGVEDTGSSLDSPEEWEHILYLRYPRGGIYYRLGPLLKLSHIAL